MAPNIDDGRDPKGALVGEGVINIVYAATLA